MSEPTVKQSLLDEARRLGERNATHASHQSRISNIAIDAIADALELMKSGRIIHARERLDKALMTVTRMSKLERYSG